ncbi:MAG: hypothetical protein WCT53_01700 [Candidatus Gracilibacteria bacterium]
METALRKLIKLFVFVLIIVAIVMLWKNIRYTEVVSPEKDLYQTVFLKDGQIFVGKLNEIYTSFPYLTDVYYPQNPRLFVIPSLRTVSLIKRGNELHAPTDKLYMTRENISYWENVGEGSVVAKTIKTQKELAAKKAAVKK